MVTRFYLSSSATTPPNSPGFAAWTRATEAVRRIMSPTKDGSAQANKTTWGNSAAAANASALAVQYASQELAAGIAFATTDTIKGYVRCTESAINDNVNRQPICLKVYNGSTLQATLKALGHIGPNTSEWVTGTAASKTLADGDTLDANYTTVAGDYLVLEIGSQVSSSGGTSVTATQVFGTDNASDIAESEGVTTVLNAWFEISRTLTFAVAPTAKATAWHVRGAISQTKASAWHVRTPVTATAKASAWHVRAAVSQAVGSAWHVRALAISAKMAAWHVRTPVAATMKAAAWHIRTAATKAASSAWSARAIATKPVSSSWHVGQAITASLFSAWHLRASVAVSVRGSAWHVRGSAAQSSASEWMIRQAIEKPQASSWSVFQTIAASATAAWDIRAAILQSKAVAWDVAAAGLPSVEKSLAAAWHVQAAIAQAQASRWHVREAIRPHVLIRWRVRAAVDSMASPTSWEIQQRVSISGLAAWSLLAIVSHAQPSRWHTLAIGGPVILRPSPRSASLPAAALPPSARGRG